MRGGKDFQVTLLAFFAAGSLLAILLPSSYTPIIKFGPHIYI